MWTKMNFLGKKQNVLIVRFTNPTLYRSVMAHAWICISLALNFWNYDPTFHPFGIKNGLIGWIFFVLGLLSFLFLNIIHSLRMVRILLVCLFVVYFLWGIANAEQWHKGDASLQLPIIYLGLSIWAFILVLAPPMLGMSGVKHE